jgi:hypothetical protein
MIVSVGSAGTPCRGPVRVGQGSVGLMFSSCRGLWIGSALQLSRGCGVFGLGDSGVGSAACGLRARCCWSEWQCPSICSAFDVRVCGLPPQPQVPQPPYHSAGAAKRTCVHAVSLWAGSQASGAGAVGGRGELLWGVEPNDPLAEGSRVVPAAHGSLEGLAVVLASRGSARFLS